MAETAIDYLAIGYVAKDLTAEGPRMGGTVAYSTLTARAFDYRPGLVTACGPDLDLSPLAGISVFSVPSPVSTTFENIYHPGGRTQYLRARAAPLTTADVPAAWRRARIVHLAPLANELDDPDLGLFASAFIGMTPQGWLRQMDEAGRVSTVPDSWLGAERVLSQASAAVLSIADLGGDWAVAERWANWAPILVITQGAQGCTVFAGGQDRRQFPASVQPELDPTGAGDVFAAAFFINLYETADPWASAHFANQVAALSVTRPGLHGVPAPEEIGYCRARAALA